ncbi:MAG: DUF1211 domain-containing protein [Planctomycetes bacterium]|nr:DUF1211 domain-containing protein [Planctomycetota bacterium]
MCERYYDGMLRAHLFEKRIVTDPLFRWRGGEVSRIEGLSDGVFALAVTMLVMRQDVPRTFHELWATLRDLPVFVASFALVMLAWRYHYLFFRRYGLQDVATIVLNSAYLLLVLFCVYPLKFLATFLWHLVLGRPVGPMFEVPAGSAPWSDLAQRSDMMVFYGLAIGGVFGLQGLMLLWALHERERLELDRVERFLTKASLVAQTITVAIALLSIGVALSGRPDIAGIVYFLMAPLHAAWGAWSAGHARKLAGAVAAGVM